MVFSTKKTDGAAKKRDWATEAADTIERTIDSVRDKAIVPLMTVARAIVFGTLVAILGVVAAVVFAVLLVRFLNIYLHNIGWMPDGIWVAYLLSGAIFVVGGAFAWSKRTASADENEG